MAKIAKTRNGEHIMKIKKSIIPLLLALCFLLCGCGRKKEEEKSEIITPKSVLSHRIEEEETAEETPKTIIYKVMLEGRTLSLFEVDGDNKKRITSIEINPDFYPDEDISELKSGIEAYYMEDGYEILENFAN